MDEGIPALGVSFEIDFHDAVGDLKSLDDLIGTTAANGLREFQRLEAATRGFIDLGDAKAQIVGFGNAVTKEVASAARELAKTEKAGEALSSRMDRLASTFGKTQQEILAMNVELRATAAEQAGLTEQAGRLREQLAGLTAQHESEAGKIALKARELKNAAAGYEAFEQAARNGAAAMREAEREKQAAITSADAFAARLEAETAAIGRTSVELKAMEIAQRAVAAEAAGMPDQAERIRAAGAAYAQAQAEVTALAAEERRLADADREAAAAHSAFEQRVREGAAAMRGAEREKQAAITSADAYVARLAAETAAIGRTSAELKAMEIAQRAAAAEAAGMPDQAERIRAAGLAYAQAQQHVAALAAEERRLADASRDAAEAAREAAAAQAAQDASVHSLRSSVDPLFGAQQRLSRELENAVRLYRSGAISQEEYERSSVTLASRINDVQQAQARQNSGLEDATRGSRIGASDLTNIAFQVQDIIVSLAGGQKPLLVMMQQGTQLSGIMMQTGASVGEMVKAVVGLAIVSTPTAAAVATLTSATAAQAAAQTASASTGSAAAIAAAELAVANEASTVSAARKTAALAALAAAEAAVATATSVDAAALAALSIAQAAATTTSAELAAAQLALAGAEVAATGASQVATAAAAELAAAQAAAAAATTAAAATATIALAPWLIALAAIAAVLGVAALGVKQMQDAANDGADMKKYASSLGLTAKEIRHLDDVTVTFGDTTKAVFQVAGAAIWDSIGPAVTKCWNMMKGWLEWFGSAAKTSSNTVIGAFVGAYNGIRATWEQLPAAMGDLFYSAVNYSIEAINSMIRKSVDGINGFITTANGLLSKVGLELPELAAPQIDKVNNQFAGAATKVGETFRTEIGKAIGVDYLSGIASTISGAVSDQARKNARERIRAEAEKKGYLDPDKPKTDKHAEKLARDAEAIEAQIRNLYALAEAYKLSGGAALIAEARVKAESLAIKERGNIEEAVDRQIRLTIAQRVADGEKAATAVVQQARAQEQVNKMVADGLAPAEQAADLLRDRMADLPLLAAIEAANLRSLTTERAKATTALYDQVAARDRLNRAQATAKFNAAIFSGDDRLAELREELRLVGATEDVRVRTLTTLKATQEAKHAKFDPTETADYIAMQVVVAAKAQELATAQRNYNDALSFSADKWDLIAQNVQNAGQGMAAAFGKAGRAIGDMASTFADYKAQEARLEQVHRDNIRAAGKEQAAIARENAKYALATATTQIGAFGDMTAAAKGFFDEKSDGYKALAVAEQTFRAIEFALSVRAMAQDAAETASKLATGAARIATGAVEAVVNAIKSLPFPLNIAAGAATVAALAGIGVSIAGAFGGGGNSSLPESNTGTGTVLGDSTAKSESIKRSIDALKEVDLLINSYSREMAASLKSIDSQIGGFASVLVRNGNINASANVPTEFQRDGIGSALNSIIGGGLLSKIPVLGGIFSAIGNFVGSLFGARYDVTGSGLYGGAQTLGSIKNGGFDADYYSDIQRTKKTFGIVTGRSSWTEYQDADPALSNQFTLILRQFNDAVAAAAGPLGMATTEVERRLNAFVVDIGRIDLQGLSGEQIQEKLAAVFGAVGDNLANAIFPDMLRFQKVGEGAFETMVRVASTVESVTNSLGLLGTGAQRISIDAKLGFADLFDSVSAMTSVTQSYFESYYTKEEQAAARGAQFAKVFESIGLAMPSTLAAFRQLVEAQDLTTAAGQATYATLLQLAPAFAELQSALMGAKSAADILSERQDLQRKLLELNGDTAAIRALDLAKLDASNRALQEQVWAVQDAQAAAEAADQLRQAWTSVGDSIMDEVKRIRGITDPTGNNSFASLMGQFNAANAAARGGDQDAAKTLPGLSQAMLNAAALVATSRQELNRVQAQTATTLEATKAAIDAFAKGGSTAADADALLAAITTAQTATDAPAANDDLIAEIRSLKSEVAQLRSDNNAGHAATAGNTGKSARVLENVSAASGGEAISVASAA